MKDTTREFLIRREKPIAVTFCLIVVLVAAVALPREYMKFVVAGIGAAIGVFYLSAVPHHRSAAFLYFALYQVVSNTALSRLSTWRPSARIGEYLTESAKESE